MTVNNASYLKDKWKMTKMLFENVFIKEIKKKKSLPVRSELEANKKYLVGWMDR